MNLKCHWKVSLKKDGKVKKVHKPQSKRPNLEDCLGDIMVEMVNGESEDVETFWILRCQRCGTWDSISENEITNNLQAMVREARWYFDKK